jgi:enolase
VIPILDFKVRVLYNSRGDESIEIETSVAGGHGRASSPSGASVGKYEAVSLFSGDASRTIEKINGYRDKLIGIDASDPDVLMHTLREIDGTPNYSGIGGSVAYSFSIASAEAASEAMGIPLYQLLLKGREARMPLPLGNVIGGGKHAGEGSPDIQEFLSYPKGAKSIAEGMRANIQVHKRVREILQERDPGFSGGKGDEGAWAPNTSTEGALEVISEAIDSVTDIVGFEIRIGLDIASSSLWIPEERIYKYSREGGKRRSTEDQIQFVLDLIDKYNLYYVEDPLHEEAFDETKELTDQAKRCLIVGDDLFVTNRKILERGVRIGAGNGVILKVNQAGALGDAIDFSELAKEHRYQIVTSHRSGDTPDAHLAHIAIGTDSLMIKSGVVGGERIAKLNELLRIDEFRFINDGQSVPVAQPR